MSRHLKTIVALALLFCVLVPAVALPRMYAPDDPRNGILEGHPNTGTQASATKTSDHGIESHYYLIVTFRGWIVIRSEILHKALNFFGI